MADARADPILKQERFSGGRALAPGAGAAEAALLAGHRHRQRHVAPIPEAAAGLRRREPPRPPRTHAPEPPGLAHNVVTPLLLLNSSVNLVCSPFVQFTLLN